jgi:hypothetical protein
VFGSLICTSGVERAAFVLCHGFISFEGESVRVLEKFDGSIFHGSLGDR